MMCRKVRRRGKSFGVGVLCEELLAAGIPVVAGARGARAPRELR
ncbi:hypothetical protein WME95_37605 [Sorangium sp. So ce327]|jgi:hypothetical protein